MIVFAHPLFLALLPLLPLFFAGQALFLWLRRRRVARLGDPALVGQLMPSRSRAKGWIRTTFLCLAWMFLVIALARPQIGAKLREHEMKGAEIMVVLDVSNSMLAEDYSPNRLERAKLAISRLVDRLDGDRIGLVIFAGTSFVQLPVTTDYVSAKMFLGTVGPGSIPIQGTAIGDAIRTALKSFSAQSEKSRAIVVITDGENHEDDPVEAAREAAGVGVKVYCIGVGSPEGKPIPVDGALLKDAQGQIVVSRLDEETLRKVAEAGSGAYVRAGNSEFGLEPVIRDIRRLEDENFHSVVFEEYNEQYMYFLALAILFFVLEMLVGERRAKRQLFE